MARRGGNGEVRFRGDRARKTLRRTNDRVALERFRREVEIVRSLDPAEFRAIVPILNCNLEEDPPWYEMRRLAGDLRDIVDRFRGDAAQAARALLPVVRDLASLADRSPAIYHRDIKPENVLFRDDNGEIKLFLTDFGIAFIDDDTSRLTRDFRAVGAQSYRAPEYQHGRVDEVTAAGDVFS